MNKGIEIYEAKDGEKVVIIDDVSFKGKTREDWDEIKEVLKQPQYQPMPVEDQIIMIYTVTRKYLLDVPVKRIQEFEKSFLEFVKTQYADIPESIRETKVMSDECEARLCEAIESFKKNF